MSEPNPSRFRRVVRRTSPPERAPLSWSALTPARLWDTFKVYFGLSQTHAAQRIDTPDALARFLDTRASFVAQTSLYGYLRTRAGMRYPELFDDDEFVVGINIAKWHVWLDCLADLAVFAGARLTQASPGDTLRIAPLLGALVDGVLEEAGTPAEAGDEFAAHVAQVRERLAGTDWLAVGEDEAAFTASPASLLRWAPVMDELKRLDEEVVRNSVRFRWLEVRRDLTLHLDLPALLAGLPDADQLPSRLPR